MNTATDEKPVVQRNPTQTEVISATAQGGHRNHYAQFMTYLRRNLLYVQRLIAATGEQPFSSEVREQALHTLSYAFGEDGLWPLVRDLLQSLAPKMELSGHREDWLPYLERALQEATRLEDQTMMAEYEYQIGLLHRLISNFKNAHEHFARSITLATANHDIRAKARALNELAWIEQLQQHYDAATEYVLQALQLLDEDDPECAVCYRVQGMIAFGRQDWGSAEALHTRALNHFQQQGDLRRMAWSLQNLAYALSAQQKYTEAIPLYLQAIETLETIGDNYHLSIVLTNLGFAYHNQRSNVAALECYRRAKTIAEELNDKLLLARLHTNLGLTYLALEDYANSQVAFTASAHLHEQIGNISLSLNAVDGLAMVYLAQHQFVQAEQLINNALEQVESVQNAPNYQYLRNSLLQHQRDARRGIESQE